jgi:hypothetical protein
MVAAMAENIAGAPGVNFSIWVTDPDTGSGRVVQVTLLGDVGAAHNLLPMAISSLQSMRRQNTSDLPQYGSVRNVDIADAPLPGKITCSTRYGRERIQVFIPPRPRQPVEAARPPGTASAVLTNYAFISIANQVFSITNDGALNPVYDTGAMRPALGNWSIPAASEFINSDTETIGVSDMIVFAGKTLLALNRVTRFSLGGTVQVVDAAGNVLLEIPNAYMASFIVLRNSLYLFYLASVGNWQFVNVPDHYGNVSQRWVFNAAVGCMMSRQGSKWAPVTLRDIVADDHYAWYPPLVAATNKYGYCFDFDSITAKTQLRGGNAWDLLLPPRTGCSCVGWNNTVVVGNTGPIEDGSMVSFFSLPDDGAWGSVVLPWPAPGGLNLQEVVGLTYFNNTYYALFGGAADGGYGGGFAPGVILPVGDGALYSSPDGLSWSLVKPFPNPYKGSSSGPVYSSQYPLAMLSYGKYIYVIFGKVMDTGLVSTWVDAVEQWVSVQRSADGVDFSEIYSVQVGAYTTQILDEALSGWSYWQNVCAGHPRLLVRAKSGISYSLPGAEPGLPVITPVRTVITGGK